MLRADLVAYIADELGDFLDAADREASDAAGKTLRPIIDNAIRAVGMVDADLASVLPLSARELDLRIQATYRALVQINRDLGATMINFSGGNASYSLRAIYDAAKDALEEARQAVLARFGTTEYLDDTSGVGFIDTNHLSPVDWST